MSKAQDNDTFHSAYEKLGETDKKSFSRIVAKLLGNNFIIREKQCDNNDYYFICENQECFESYFSLMDYELVMRKEIGVIYVQTLANRDRIRLSKFDTALLLVLRKIYNLKKKEITTTDQIFVTVDDLISEMDTAQVMPDSKQVSKYNDALRKFRSHSIVEFSATRIDENTSIHILPSIQVVIPQEKLEEIIRRINDLKKESDVQEDNEDEDSDQN